MIRRCLLLLLSLFLCGCSIGYVIRQGIGQIAISLNSRKTSALLEDPTIAERERSKIRLILQVKEFVESRLGFSPSANYSRYYDNRGRPVSYVVSACRADRFEPHIWSFLIVGDVPYKGFFDIEDAVAEKLSLEEQGFDVSLHPVAAYSTLGWFTDPIFATMLTYPDYRLIDLIIHELLHGTVYAHGSADFNESLASFIAHKGTLLFLRGGEGQGSDAPENFYEDERDYGRFVDALYKRLDDLYRSSSDRATILREKSRIIDDSRRELDALRQSMKSEAFRRGGGEKWNNAEILALRRYNRDEVYESVYRQASECPKCFLRIMRLAADSDDPFAFLESFVKRRSSSPDSTRFPP